MRRFSSFLVGAITGALVGSVVALLLAPEAGDKLRSRAQQAITSFADEVRSAYDERMGQLENELAALRTEGESSSE